MPRTRDSKIIWDLIKGGSQEKVPVTLSRDVGEAVWRFLNRCFFPTEGAGATGTK